jgi:hypothetical protein
VEARVLPAGLVTPREQPVVQVRLAAPRRSTVRLRLAAAGGRTLARRGPVQVGPRPRTVRLRLTSAGERLLGRCARARLHLVVRTEDGRERRLPARTTIDAVRCGPLRWAPPALENARKIWLSKGFDQIRLDPGRDYVLRLPRGRKLGGTFVEGGRNVVLIGGHITLPRGTARDEERRALYFKGQTGTVHVEGVLIDGSGGGEGDAIALNAPAAAVQIQNVRVTGLRGSEQGTHGDVVQPWGGVRELRIDRVSGSSRFQGLQLPASLGPIGSAHVRYTDLRALAPSARAAYVAGAGGGHMLWLTPAGTCTSYPVALEQVWVAARPGRTLRDSVWPGVADGSPCAAVGATGAVRWPNLPVLGIVREGAPPGGDFVPRWSVGSRYHSPGYLDAEAARIATAADTTAWAASVVLKSL